METERYVIFLFKKGRADTHLAQKVEHAAIFKKRQTFFFCEHKNKKNNHGELFDAAINFVVN